MYRSRPAFGLRTRERTYSRRGQDGDADFASRGHNLRRRVAGVQLTSSRSREIFRRRRRTRNRPFGSCRGRAGEAACMSAATSRNPHDRTGRGRPEHHFRTSGDAGDDSGRQRADPACRRAFEAAARCRKLRTAGRCRTRGRTMVRRPAQGSSGTAVLRTVEICDCAQGCAYDGLLPRRALFLQHERQSRNGQGRQRRRAHGPGFRACRKGLRFPFRGNSGRMVPRPCRRRSRVT